MAIEDSKAELAGLKDKIDSLQKLIVGMERLVLKAEGLSANPGDQAAGGAGSITELPKTTADFRAKLAEARTAAADVTTDLARIALKALGEGNLPPAAPSAAQAPKTGDHVGAKDVGTRSSPVSPNAIRLSTFFAEVGRGLVDAQRELDSESRRYLEETRNSQGFGLPSVFRVPKVSAEFQMALENKDEKGFNVIVFSKDETERRAMQQKVSFDIVSIPPTPELLQGLAERELVRARLQAVQSGKNYSDSDKQLAKAMAGDLDRVAIVPGPAGWLLACVAADKQLGLAVVPVAVDTPLSFAQLRPADPDRYRDVFQWLYDWADARAGVSG